MKRALVVTVGLVLGVASMAMGARGLQLFVDCTDGGRCEGTGADEFLQGGDLVDQIYARGGDDGMEGEGEPDELFGGPGNDVLEGGQRGDEMRGGPGNDREPIKATLRGPTVPSQFRPGFFGDEGNDKIYGGDGNDYLEGEQGVDRHFAGDGRDYIDAINDDTKGSRDRLDCGKGFDRYSARAGDVVADNCEKKISSPPPLR